MQDTLIMDTAAAYGHLDLVKWQHTNRSGGISAEAVDGVVQVGHLELVKYLLENASAACTKDALYFAGTHGYLNIS